MPRKKKAAAKDEAPKEVTGPEMLGPPPAGRVPKAAPVDIEMLFGAATAGVLESVQAQLIKHQDKTFIHSRSFNRKFTLLQAACGGGNVEIVNWLLKAGAKAELADKCGVTSLMTAACLPETGMLKAILASASGKKCLDAVDDDGSTALHHAAFCGKREAVTLLLVAGASTEIEDKAGKTASVDAADAGHADVAALIEAGVPEASAKGDDEEDEDAAEESTRRPQKGRSGRL